MWLQCASRTVLGLVIGTVLLLTVEEAEGATEGAALMARVWYLVVLVAMAERRL